MFDFKITLAKHPSCMLTTEKKTQIKRIDIMNYNQAKKYFFDLAAMSDFVELFVFETT